MDSMQHFPIKLNQNNLLETNQCTLKLCLLKMLWFSFVKTIIRHHTKIVPHLIQVCLMIVHRMVQLHQFIQRNYCNGYATILTQIQLAVPFGETHTVAQNSKNVPLLFTWCQYISSWFSNSYRSINRCAWSWKNVVDGLNLA